VRSYGHQGEIIGLDCDHRERPITVSRDHTVRLWKVQVRFCRYRFSPTGELGYSGIRGAEG
jgi:hypothetical protein